MPTITPSDMHAEATRRMFNILMQELRMRNKQQISANMALRICVARLDKPLAKALGGKDVLAELAARMIDACLDNGFFIQVEADKRVMLRFNRAE